MVTGYDSQTTFERRPHHEKQVTPLLDVDPAANAERREQVEHVRLILHNMRAIDANILYYHLIEGFSFQRIAEELDLVKDGGALYVEVRLEVAKVAFRRRVEGRFGSYSSLVDSYDW